MSEERIVSVSSVLQRIKVILSQTFDFSMVWIQGEVSNLTKHRSGHYYFSIKDANGEMSCAMFSSYVRHLDFSLEEGMKILVQGSVNVYEPRGSLQLYVKRIRQDGMGALFLEYQKRYRQLEKEGYFDNAHKKKKPDFIETIGVITAKEGAALQDVLKTIQRRWPMLRVRLFPAYVQGNLAPKSLIQQIQKADALHLDALLIVRGGGSFEDLFCFNDVELVKTLYDCQTYTVSGVGHEVDTTLCDLVCDHRSVTPTAAAQWVTPDQNEVHAQIDSLKNQLFSLMSGHIRTEKQRFRSVMNHPYLKDPRTWIQDKQVRLDAVYNVLEHRYKEWTHKKDNIYSIQLTLTETMSRKLERVDISVTHQQEMLCRQLVQYFQKQKDHFSKNVSLLDAFSPLKTLGRGYSIIERDHKIVRHITELDVGDTFEVRLADGQVSAKVQSKKEGNVWPQKN